VQAPALRDCHHGEPCVHGALGVRYPHPLTASRYEAHLAFDGDNMMHEWSGKSTRCKVSENPDDETRS
jgi:hypothetical protein